MQIKTATILAVFAAAATAQSIDQLVSEIPSCAISCINDASTAAGCGNTDYTCQCENIQTLEKNSFPCIQKACSVDDLKKTTSVTSNICLAVAQQVGSDTYSSALSAGSSITSDAGSALTSATGAAGSAFTSATGAFGSAFSSATDAAGSSLPTATPGAAPGQAVAGVGMVGAAALFAAVL